MDYLDLATRLLSAEGFAVVPQIRLDAIDRFARYDPAIAYPSGAEEYPEQAVVLELEACREALASYEQ